MSVMNRKLFKTRPARDKLNKMGGIMSSSQPLMNTVQRFNLGGGVQSTAGTRIPINPRLADQQRASDIALGRRIKGNLLYPVGEAADLIVNRPAAGLQNLLNDLKYSAAGRFVGASEYGEQKPAPRTGTPARQSIIDYMNTGELRRTGIFRDTQAPEVVSSAQASDQDSIKKRLESQGYDLSGDQIYSPQPSTLGSMDPEGRPRTPVEAESDALAESILPSDMVAPGTREAEEEGMGEGLLGGYTTMTAEGKAKTGPPIPMPVPRGSLDSYIEENQAAVKSALDQQTAFLKNPSVSEIEKSDFLLEQFGYKDPDERIKGLKERSEKLAQMYKEVAGVDPAEDMKIDGYNLAMMGFMIAAGDDPNALTNIAKGMAYGTEKMLDTKKARQKRDQQFKMAGLEQAIKEDDERKKIAIDAYNKSQDRQYDLLKTQVANAQDRQTLLLKLSFEEDQNNKKIAANLKIAEDRNSSDAAKEAARNNIYMLQELNKSMPGYASIIMKDAGAGADIADLDIGAGIQGIMADPELKAEADALNKQIQAKTGKSVTPGRSATFQFQTITDDPAKLLDAFGPMADEQLESELGRKPTETERYNRSLEIAAAQAGVSTTAPAAPAAGAQEITTQAEYDALAPGAQFMQNGQLRQKPAQ